MRLVCHRWPVDEVPAARPWFTGPMSEQDNTDDVEMTIERETEVVDVDGDGVADMVVETTTTAIDVDGDGMADIVQQTTTTAIDVDSDGMADIIDETTVTAVDADGDGEFSDDEIEVEETLAVRDDLVDDTDA